MADWQTKLRAITQARIDDASSGQGTLSREVEAAGREAVSLVAEALAAMAGSKTLREYARDQNHTANMRLSRSDWLQSTDQPGTIGDMLGYIAHLAIQATPYMLTFGAGVLIWRAIVKRPLKPLEKAAAGAALLFFFVFGAFLRSSTGPYGIGAYDISGSVAPTIIALFLAFVCGSLLNTIITNALRFESEALDLGTRWTANAAIMLPLASVYRAALVPLDEFLIGAVVLLLAGMAIAFALGCSFHLARKAIAANTAGGKEQYQAAFEEFNRGDLDTGLWAQCLAKADGNETVAKARYLKARASELTR